MFVLLVSIALLSQASSAMNFHFPSFKPTDCSGHFLRCSGSVTSTNHGFLSLTSQDKGANLQVGRVMYLNPIDTSSKSISTSFSFRIFPSANPLDSADGMSFIMASDATSSENSGGSYLGIMDRARDGSASGQLAVEFDTYKNDETNDMDANHVAIVTQSLKNPLASKSFNHSGIDLKNGTEINIKIVIKGRGIKVSAKYYDEKKFAKIVNTKIDISKVLPSIVFVGFTAATGDFTQSHQLLTWSFSS